MLTCLSIRGVLLCIIWLCKKKWGRNQEKSEAGKLSEHFYLPFTIVNYSEHCFATSGGLAMEWWGHRWFLFGFIRKWTSCGRCSLSGQSPSLSQGIPFWGCWPMLDHFSFLLECNSLPYLLNLSIWVEFLGKDVAHLHGRLKVPGNTVLTAWHIENLFTTMGACSAVFEASCTVIPQSYCMG